MRNEAAEDRISSPCRRFPARQNLIPPLHDALQPASPPGPMGHSVSRRPPPRHDLSRPHGTAVLLNLLGPARTVGTAQTGGQTGPPIPENLVIDPHKRTHTGGVTGHEHIRRQDLGADRVASGVNLLRVAVWDIHFLVLPPDFSSLTAHGNPTQGLFRRTPMVKLTLAHGRRPDWTRPGCRSAPIKAKAWQRGTRGGVCGSGLPRSAPARCQNHCFRLSATSLWPLRTPQKHARTASPTGGSPSRPLEVTAPNARKRNRPRRPLRKIPPWRDALFARDTRRCCPR